jgi:hypothetical protein
MLFEEVVMRIRALLSVSALLCCIYAGVAGAQNSQTIVVTNDSGSELKCEYRAIYNDGRGSDKRSFAVSFANGQTMELRAAGVPDYGIVVRLAGDGTTGVRHLYAKNGPYKIRLGRNPLDPAAKVFDIFDARGEKVQVRRN